MDEGEKKGKNAWSFSVDPTSGLLTSSLAFLPWKSWMPSTLMLPNARFVQRCFINHWQLCRFKTQKKHYTNSTHDACAIANRFVDFKAKNSHRSLPDELYFEPNFLCYDEQISLLTAALRKLDSLASPRSRRLQKRRRLQSQRHYLQGENDLPKSVMGLFRADEDYDFEEVRLVQLENSTG